MGYKPKTLIRLYRKTHFRVGLQGMSAVNSEVQNAARALTVDAARAFIGQCEWTFAKTMPWAPHEYIVRRNVDNDKFVGFVKLIREQGARRKWGRYRNLDSRRMELLNDGRADSDHDHHQPGAH
jgi:hypothetical protein